MAAALSGAVVVKQDGKRVTYKKKCESCGTVAPGSTTTTVSPNSTLRSSFRCTKCKTNQKIAIQGG